MSESVLCVCLIFWCSFYFLHCIFVSCKPVAYNYTATTKRTDFRGLGLFLGYFRLLLFFLFCVRVQIFERVLKTPNWKNTGEIGKKPGICCFCSLPVNIAWIKKKKNENENKG